MAIYFNGKTFEKKKYKFESDFEKMIFEKKSLFFGDNTILIDAKTKISGGPLGNTIPDGFLFDFSDSSDIKFYIIEVELSNHSFYRHIFPQITKFFSFLRTGNPSQIALVEKIYDMISKDEELLKSFSEKIENIELYKFLKDTIENSQDILILIDENISEFTVIKEVYTDTWDKYVKILKIEEYVNGMNSVFSVTPNFRETLFETVETSTQDDGSFGSKKYTEEFHLEDKSDFIKQIYYKIRENLSGFTFNPQKHYISIRNSKNFVFLILKKKLIHVIVRLQEEEIRKSIKNHEVKSLTDSVQNFYNGPCADIIIREFDHIDEVCNTLQKAATNIESEAA